MANRIALTSVGPYVGATTLGKYLMEHHGFLHVSMSTKLIEAYMEDRGISLSMLDTLVQNRESFRPALREFAHRSGFHTEPRWMQYCLAAWAAISPERDVVIEKVRTDEQARTLKEMGFTVVELAISKDEQIKRASYEWVTRAELEAHLADPVEKGISEGLIDTILLAEGPVASYGGYVAHLSTLRQQGKG